MSKDPTIKSWLGSNNECVLNGEMLFRNGFPWTVDFLFTERRSHLCYYSASMVDNEWFS